MKRFNGYGGNQQKVQPMKPQQVTFNVEGEEPERCVCGCAYFTPAVMVYKVSALVSPTGQELIAQRPVLLCMECRAVLGQKKAEGGANNAV